jgi:dihydropteroate synthase
MKHGQDFFFFRVSSVAQVSDFGFMTLSWQLPDRVLSLDQRALVMGIVNVTPDSFSDGGLYVDRDAAVNHAFHLVEQGADILDIGGESSRPGAQPISFQEERDRVLPVVQELVRQTSVPLSIDTCKAAVADACLAAGAHIINDITALAGDSDMAAVIAARRAGVILMHMQGTPATMQRDPSYQNVVQDVFHFLEERLHWATAAGIGAERVVVDPGLGFGKKVVHNLDLLAYLNEFLALGRPLCLGVSRKSLLGKLLNRPVEERLPGSLAATCYALVHQAAHIVRVHDVKETRDAITVIAAIQAQITGATPVQRDDP